MNKSDYLKNKEVKRVAVVNDLSSFGKCSLTASLPIFSCMGIQACPLPTAVLSCQTAFEEYFKQDMTFVWDGYFESWRKMGVTFDAIQSGYLTDENQIRRVAEFVKEFGKKDTLFVVDPVLGDDGRLYSGMGQKMVQEMKNLIAVSDICTPNLTELCLLRGVDADEALKKTERKDFFDWLKEQCKILQSWGCKAVVVTGIRQKDSVCNFVCSREGDFVTTSPSFKVNMSGAGDILCSIITSEVMLGKSLFDAVNLADKFLTKAILDTTKGKYDTKHGINFGKYLKDLV